MAQSVLKGPKNNIVFFGDSWTMGTGIVMEDRPTKRFTAIIAKKLGLIENNYGVGGAGFVRNGNLFSTQITTASSNMTSEQKNNTKYVVIVGGVNDYRHKDDDSTTLTSFVNGVVSTITKAHNVFPNAKIVLGLGDTCLSYFPQWAKEWYHKAMISVESSVQFPCMVIKNLYNVISGNTAEYSSDGLHPNESGHSKFGGYLANAILGGGQTVHYIVGAVTRKSGITWSASGGVTLPANLYRIDDEYIITPCCFDSSTAISSNTAIASIPVQCSPSQNMYGQFYRANQAKGACCITASGSIYVNPTESVSGGFLSQLRWFFGKEINTDES